MIIQQKCPICEGKKVVPSGFYKIFIGDGVSTSITEPCQNCCGNGIVYIKQDEEINDA